MPHISPPALPSVFDEDPNAFPPIPKQLSMVAVGSDAWKQSIEPYMDLPLAKEYKALNQQFMASCEAYNKVRWAGGRVDGWAGGPVWCCEQRGWLVQEQAMMLPASDRWRCGVARVRWVFGRTGCQPTYVCVLQGMGLRCVPIRPV